MFPPKAGGSGRWFWELYRRLPRDEYVIAAGEHPGWRAFDQTHDLDIVRMPLTLASWGVVGGAKYRNYTTIANKLQALVRERRVASIHAGCCLPEGYLARWIGRKQHIPYSVYVHGEELRITAASRELAWMTRRVFRDAQMLIANSRNTAKLLRQDWRINENKIQVLHPGVDTKQFKPAPPDEAWRRAHGWNDRRVILTVGRLQKRKGHDMLIRALPKIREVVPNVLYAIVGDGDERAALEQLTAQLEVQQHVQFLGALTDEAIIPCYQQCDLFALPNREVDGDFEGFGIVLLEAQACGKPVIAGDSGGTAETMVHGETGEIVDCTGPVELVDAVTKQLKDGRRRSKMGCIGRAWVVDHLSWAKLAGRAATMFYRKDASPMHQREHLPELEPPVVRNQNADRA